MSVGTEWKHLLKINGELMTIYNFCWTVLIYGFLGWCAEVAFAAVKHGKFVNRGFLNGAICPIYGFGVLIVTAVLDPFKDNIILLFLGSVVFTSLLEFLTGFILEKLFHEKWWDYSNRKLNIKGYICVEFSLLWGVAATVIVMFVHPSIMWCVSKIPTVLGIVLLALLYAIFVTDLVLTLIGILKIPKQMKAIVDVEAALKHISDEIGSNVADAVFNAEKKGADIQQKTEKISASLADKSSEIKTALGEKRSGIADDLSEKYARLEELKARRAKLLKPNYSTKRIFRAFPNLTNGRFKGAVEKLRENAVLIKKGKEKQE